MELIIDIIIDQTIPTIAFFFSCFLMSHMPSALSRSVKLLAEFKLFQSLTDCVFHSVVVSEKKFESQ